MKGKPTFLAFLLLWLLSGCGFQDKGGHIIFKYNGFEIFYSEPIKAVDIIDNRVYVTFSLQDRRVLLAVADRINEKVMIDIYIGKEFYTSALIDFERIDFMKEEVFSIPKESERMDKITNAGFRIRR